MPMKPPNPCKQPGCPNLTHESYCKDHAPIHKRAGASARGYSSRWQRLSKKYLQAHPLCAKCRLSGRLTPATVVDHKQPHRGDPQLMWREDNWQALCKACHDAKTGRQDSRPVYKY